MDIFGVLRVLGFLHRSLLILGISFWKISSFEVWIVVWLFWMVFIWFVEVDKLLLTSGMSGTIRVKALIW